MITPTLYDNPKFYDKFVQEINEDLSALSWLEYVFPIAFKGEDSEGTYPEVYKNDGTRDSIRIYPDGNSLSFFVLNNIPQIGETNYFSVDMSLYVWADLTKADTSKSYNYTIDLMKDVRGVLEAHSIYNSSIELNDVFSDYSQLAKVINQNTMLPNAAFKFNFTADVLFCSETLILFQSAEVTDNVLTITYNRNLLTTSVPNASDYTLTGTDAVVSNVAISGKTVVLTLDVNALVGEVVILNYTSGDNPVKDLESNEAANLTNKSITNNNSFNATYQAIYDEFTTTPSTADANYQNTFVKTLVDGGVWDKCPELFCLAGHNESDSLIDWKDPTGTKATLVGSTVFVAHEGFTSSGAGYIDFNYVPYGQGSIGMTAYIRSIGSGIIFGGGSGFSRLLMYANGQCVMNSTGSPTLFDSTQVGMRTMQRTSGTIIKGYANGTFRVQAGHTIVSASGSEIFGLKSNGEDDFFTGQLAFHATHNSFTASDNLILYNAFQALMTSYGTQV